ncbi:hypothetical protein GCM10010245_92230 [Streptomyces spectabilis]|nr:hypothetical protein GCM10010245_92230 [Streptomyces spectabilis]
MLRQEITVKGYQGHYQRVKMAIAPLRRGLPIDTPREWPPLPRQVALSSTTSSHRDLHAAEALERLLTYCPELDRPMTWCVSSPRGSTPVTQRCRPGSGNSPRHASRP